MAEELLTVAEVADRLKVNQQTVRNWLTQGALPEVRVGPRRIRVKVSDVEAFVGSEVGQRTEEDSSAGTARLRRPDVEAGGKLTRGEAKALDGCADLLLDWAARLDDAPIGRDVAEVAGRLKVLARRPKGT